MCGPGSNHGSGAHHHEHGHILVPEAYLTRRSFFRAGTVGLGAVLLAACGRKPDPLESSLSTSGVGAGTTVAPGAQVGTTSTGVPDVTAAPTTVPSSGLAGFDEFASTVSVTRDGKWWLVESNGLPAHDMMVGITSWQQQVPVSQPYTGSNAWRIPVEPEIAGSPVSARTALYRGAIALAANGVPIFNALNNRGTTRSSTGNSTSGVVTPDEPMITTTT